MKSANERGDNSEVDGREKERQKGGGGREGERERDARAGVVVILSRAANEPVGRENETTGTEKQKKEKNGGSGCAIMFYDSHL